MSGKIAPGSELITTRSTSKNERNKMKKTSINTGKVLIIVTASVMLLGISARASETDDRIESSAKKSYVFKTYLKNDAIKVDSASGVVTLTGTVGEDSHKSLAENTVASLPGVTSVNNQLKTKGKIPPNIRTPGSA